MKFKLLNGNLIKSIQLLHDDGQSDITPIVDHQDFQQAYGTLSQVMVDGDELYVHVRSKANAPSDEQGSKIYF